MGPQGLQKTTEKVLQLERTRIAGLRQTYGGCGEDGGVGLAEIKGGGLLRAG